MIAACTAVGFLGGAAAPQWRVDPMPSTTPQTLRVGKLLVVDEVGRIGAELSPRGLDFLGQDGRARATLRLYHNDNGVLGFSDSNSKAEWFSASSAHTTRLLTRTTGA